MGGKSTLMRQTGLTIILAQMVILITKKRLNNQENKSFSNKRCNYYKGLFCAG